MKKTLLALQASSPEELNACLPNILKNNKSRLRYITLSITGPRVLVRSFDFENLAIKEIKNRLKFEAVELLSLPVEEIEFDFQILNSTREKTSGVFICLPKNLLKSYIHVLDKANLIPIKITAHILAMMDAFFQKHKTNNGRFCLLDFSESNKIKLAVFNNRQYELLREISYENLDEAKVEVMQSLRSACAKSHVKQLDYVYFSGDLTGKEELMTQVEGDFNTKIEREPSLDIGTALCCRNNFFSLNLIRNYFFSLPERKQILAVMDLILFLCLLGCIDLTYKVKQTEILISDLSSSYTPVDLEYAKQLKKQLKSL